MSCYFDPDTAFRQKNLTCKLVRMLFFIHYIASLVHNQVEDYRVVHSFPLTPEVEVQEPLPPGCLQSWLTERRTSKPNRAFPCPEHLDVF